MNYCQISGHLLIKLNKQYVSGRTDTYIERFNRTFREDVLDANWLMSLKHAQQLTDEWREDYNNYHPHGSLGYKSPLVYRKSFHEGSRDQEAVKAEMNSVVPPSALTASCSQQVAV